MPNVEEKSNDAVTAKNNEETKFNLKDPDVDDIELDEGIGDFVNSDNSETNNENEYVTVCDRCGSPMKADWNACPKCGKVLPPLDPWMIIETIEDAPTKDQIETLKKEKGIDIRVALFDDDRVYFLRPLLRQQWKNFNEKVKTIKDDSVREDQLMKLVVQSCVVWPLPNSDRFGQRAGTFATLFEQIMQISDFIPPNIAVQMVYRV